MPDLTWQKSTYSGNSGCLEVARTKNLVLLRDSKDPDGRFLAVLLGEWQAFLLGVKAGEFDQDTDADR